MKRLKDETKKKLLDAPKGMFQGTKTKLPEKTQKIVLDVFNTYGKAEEISGSYRVELSNNTTLSSDALKKLVGFKGFQQLNATGKNSYMVWDA